jgi:hypothetical protein
MEFMMSSLTFGERAEPAKMMLITKRIRKKMGGISRRVLVLR